MSYLNNFKNNTKAYYQLTKPGIIRGNSITAAAGFFLASDGILHLGLFLAMLGGLSLVVASACVFNNYIDQDIDKKMARTRTRALVSHAITERAALVFGTTLGLAGILLLGLYVNLLTCFVALTGFIFYVFIYTSLKRKTVHGTLIGSISGATPPVAGYTAVSQTIDINAILLFLVLVLWQMPHFYAIAIYRLADYKAATIPVLPIVKGLSMTKKQIMAYIVAFGLLAPALAIEGKVGTIYVLIMVVCSGAWLSIGLSGFQKEVNDVAWAKKMFFFSLLVITAFSGSIIVDSILI
jgi:heme o synthase